MDDGEFQRAMALHEQELRFATERARPIPILAQLGVVGVAGGLILWWSGAEGQATASAGLVAAVAGLVLFSISMLVSRKARETLE